MTQLRWDGTNPAAGRREPPGPVRPGPIPSRDTTPPAPDRDRPTPPTAGCAWTRRACGQHRRPSAGFRDDLHLVRLADLGLRPTERSSTSTTSPTAGDWTCVWSKSWPWIPPGLPAHPRTVPGPQRQRLRRLPSPSPPLRDSAVRACNAAPARRKPLACSWRRSPGFLHQLRARHTEVGDPLEPHVIDGAEDARRWPQGWDVEHHRPVWTGGQT